MNSKQLGDWGEKIAEDYLKNKRYRILDKNYVFRIRCGPPKGEIDIVAEKDKIVSFIEVKTLISNKIISPEAEVDFSKKKKTIKAAQFWLMKNKLPLDAKWQIDVIAIEINSQNKKAKIRHLENAIIS